MSREITLEAFQAELKSQGVSGREHAALVCVMCKCPQSITSFVKAGVSAQDAERYIGFSCVGRFTGAGSPRAKPDGQPCNWTLGGLLTWADLYVLTPEGGRVASFEIATPEQARELEASQ